MPTFATRQNTRVHIQCLKSTAYICDALSLDGHPVNCRKVAISRDKKHEQAADESGFYVLPVAGYPGYFLLQKEDGA